MAIYLYCKKCGHVKQDHYGIDGECLHTDENLKWDCDCKKFVLEKESK